MGGYQIDEIAIDAPLLAMTPQNHPNGDYELLMVVQDAV
jgi:hypothetical protein